MGGKVFDFTISAPIVLTRELAAARLMQDGLCQSTYLPDRNCIISWLW